MSASFWKQAAATLPPEVRERHAEAFEAAERLEQALKLCAEGWRGVKRALAASCRFAAGALRAAARLFDTAARHLSLKP